MRDSIVPRFARRISAMRAGALDFESIAGEMPQHSLGHLAASRVVRADEQHFLHRVSAYSHRKRNVAASPPASCAPRKGITSAMRIPVKVLVNARASVTAGFANDVEEVNQYAAAMYAATTIGTTFGRLPVAVHDRDEPERRNDFTPHLRSSGPVARGSLKDVEAEHQMGGDDAGDSADELRDDARKKLCARRSALDHGCDRHDGIEVRARDRSEREDERDERRRGRGAVGEEREGSGTAGETLAHDSRSDDRAEQQCGPDRLGDKNAFHDVYDTRHSRDLHTHAVEVHGDAPIPFCRPPSTVGRCGLALSGRRKRSLRLDRLGSARKNARRSVRWRRRGMDAV